LRSISQLGPTSNHSSVDKKTAADQHKAQKREITTPKAQAAAVVK
jgi:hypothetical protein